VGLLRKGATAGGALGRLRSSRRSAKGAGGAAAAAAVAGRAPGNCRASQPDSGRDRANLEGRHGVFALTNSGLNYKNRARENGVGCLTNLHRWPACNNSEVAEVRPVNAA
jgi:hypothetical protein